MADRQRRRTPAQTARLIALVAANLACLFVAFLAVRREPHPAAAEPPAIIGVLPAVSPPAAASAAPTEPTARPASPSRIALDKPTAKPRSSLHNSKDRALESRIKKRIAAALEQAISEIQEKLPSGEVSVSVHVRELAVPGDLVSIEADRAMRPASNLKLVTTAAALVLLGPDWTFDTRFETDGQIENGRLLGDLIVRAAGDPLFDLDAAGDVGGFFKGVIAELEHASAHTIGGALVLDEGDFQAPSPGPAWPTDRDRWKEYCALAGGFSANAGCLTATVRLLPNGTANVDVRPKHHGFPERIEVTTVGAKQGLDIKVGAMNGSVIVEGTLPRDVPEWSARFAVPDPVELFGRTLLGALEAKGIDVREGVRRERRPANVQRRLLARISTPLASTLVPINTHSNNACADQLFLAMGHALEGRGTREGGRAASVRALMKLGLPTAGFVQVDGSGLSRENRVTARQITALVDAVLCLDGRTAKMFLDSLAVPSGSGTLDERMKDPDLAGRVHAKTGFIAGTSALSGIVDAHDGRTLVFSILVEYPTIEGLNKTCWKPMEDAICEDLAGSDG